MTRRFVFRAVAPLALLVTALCSTPTSARQQFEAQNPDRPVVRRRAPDRQKRNALPFVRTELFFGTAKPEGAVTAEEFKAFVDGVITPLFPEGLTVIDADGQFRNDAGVVVKEKAFVLVLLYPVEDQKASSKNIDYIRREYMRVHQQESVLRADDPFLVWVSF